MLLKLLFLLDTYKLKILIAEYCYIKVNLTFQYINYTQNALQLKIISSISLKKINISSKSCNLQLKYYFYTIFTDNSSNWKMLCIFLKGIWQCIKLIKGKQMLFYLKSLGYVLIKMLKNLSFYVLLCILKFHFKIFCWLSSYFNNASFYKIFIIPITIFDLMNVFYFSWIFFKGEIKF